MLLLKNIITGEKSMSEDVEFVDVIDLDNKIVKVLADSGLYYSDGEKNYSARIDFKEIFGNMKNYFHTGYEEVNINDLNKDELIKDNYEGQFIFKIVLNDSTVIKHYYTFIGFDSEEIIKVVPVKIPKDNLYTVDPSKIISTNWYYIKSAPDNTEYFTINNITEGEEK